MQNKLSRAAPLLFLPLILLNTLFSQTLLIDLLGENYTYLYMPLFWLALGAAAFFIIRKKHYRAKLKGDIIFWVCVASVLYLIMRFTSGIFEGFGYSPYDRSFLGILRNLFAYYLPNLCREVVRAAVVMSCKPGKKRTKVICVVTTFVLALSEMNVNRLLRGFSTPFGAFEQLGGYFMPALVTSAMLTLAAMYAGFLPGIIYQSAVTLLFYFIPVMPDSTWLTISLLGSLIPLITAIVINYTVGLANHTMTRRDMKEDSPASWVVTFVLLMAFVLFVTGVLPYYPVAVATGSMEPTIMTGDMVVVDKTEKTKDAIDVGDVVQFKRGTYTVIHRIIEKHDTDGTTFFVTKGDNNASPDSGEITYADIVGKVQFRVRYVGYLTLWMHSQKVEDDTSHIDVETGGHNNG